MHTLERLGIYTGHTGSSAPIGSDKSKREKVMDKSQQNASEQKLSIQNRATMAKTVLNLIAFVQKQAPVID